MEDYKEKQGEGVFDMQKIFMLLQSKEVIESLIKIIQFAENYHQRPVCHFDIFQASLQVKDIQIPLNSMLVNIFITHLFGKDMIYANQTVNFFSLQPLPGLKKLSDFLLKFPNYSYDSVRMMLIPKEDTPAADMHEVYQVLLSKDYNEEELASKLSGDEKLLRNNGLTEPKVAFATFPRCGNTFLKKYLQEVTNMACADDVNFPVTMRYQLMFNGLIGTGWFGDQSWLSLTHHPLKLGPFEPFKANMVLGLARNPLDVFNSSFLISLTSSFDIQFDGNYEEMLKEDWEDVVLHAAQQYLDYHLNLIKECEDKKVPLYIARYEDLLDNLEGELKGIFEYLLGSESLEGTYAMKRIQNLVKEGEKVSVYTKKYATYNSNAHRFSNVLLQKIKEILKPLLIYFGYVKNTKIEKHCSTFDFYQFNEQEITEEEWQNYCAFKDLNSKSKEYRINNKEEIFKNQISLNGEGCNVKMSQPKLIFREKYADITIKIPADIKQIQDTIKEKKNE